jgi:nitroimidazol reductase NimA-like FMN-containing flavoprotein (pyridoxamine 5'-phosphate oxidase superfamily)
MQFALAKNSEAQYLVPTHIIMSLEEQKIPIRIGCISTNGYPCVLSLWFSIMDGRIYCATKKNAKIVEYLEKNPACGFEIASDQPPYRGIRGNGICNIRPKDGKKILSLLIRKYLGQKNPKLEKFLLNNSDKEVALEIIPNKVFHYDYTSRMGNANQ